MSEQLPVDWPMHMRGDGTRAPYTAEEKAAREAAQLAIRTKRVARETAKRAALRAAWDAMTPAQKMEAIAVKVGLLMPDEDAQPAEAKR